MFNEKLSPLPVPLDVDGFMYDANSLFNPLHKDFMLDFHVSGVKDGYVYLSFALPEGMTRVFVSLLESLTGLFRSVNVKSRSALAVARTLDPADVLRRQGQGDKNRQMVVSVFDELIGQGCTVKNAISRTNSILKARGNAWVTYELVRSFLSASGRLRKGKGVPV